MRNIIENIFPGPDVPRKIPDSVKQEGMLERQGPSDAVDQFTGRMMRGVIKELAKEEVRLQLKSLNKNLGFIKINTLPNRPLKFPIDAVVEPDDIGFLARTTDLPLYGYGDDPIEAVQMLKREIESLYNDLMNDDNFNEEHLRIKEFLKIAIAE